MTSTQTPGFKFRLSATKEQNDPSLDQEEV